MRLNVDETGVEQLFGPVDGERFDLVRRRAALIIAAAGIALGIFVGEDRPLRFEHRFRDDILRRDQFDLILRSEEHTSELQSLMRNSYAVFCLNKKIPTTNKIHQPNRYQTS